MLASDNSIFPSIVKNLDDTNGAKMIYSMWKGYLTEKLNGYCNQEKLEIEDVHTSGHDSVEDLQAFAKAINPKMLAPIHTFSADKFVDLFDNVRLVNDGDVIII